MKLRSKKIAAICCAAVMAVTCAVPAFAATKGFQFTMKWFQEWAYNEKDPVPKNTDHDPNFYVTPNNSRWNPNSDNAHVYAINSRDQECNRDDTANRLMGNHRHKIPYYYASVPAPRQEMNIKLKEFNSGLHDYEISGQWTP